NSTKTAAPVKIISKERKTPVLDIEKANQLVALPLHCVGIEYPNKLNQTVASDEDLQSPQALHPIFYGCFDWHSAVHGYWSLIVLAKEFPALQRRDAVMTLLKQAITKENVAVELAYFEDPTNKSYERTYGWAWLLKMAEALHAWEDPTAQELAANLQPLTDLIVERYKEFLPKLVYPIRSGEHPNTAFGLAFAYDYAKTTGETELLKLISQRAKYFYMKDASCPIGWEPSGFDFLSPCLEEIDIMRRVLIPSEFKNWLQDFLPQLKEVDFKIPMGEVKDRSDGKLVHLDGVNFSRAWVLYGLANQYPDYDHLIDVANEHLSHSYANMIDDNYEGGHWLGSFAIYALQQTQP
ncbi:MAG: hypothetical protein ACI86L_001958, partial [Dokdonia sp.]